MCFNHLLTETKLMASATCLIGGIYSPKLIINLNMIRPTNNHNPKRVKLSILNEAQNQSIFIV